MTPWLTPEQAADAVGDSAGIGVVGSDDAGRVSR